MSLYFVNVSEKNLNVMEVNIRTKVEKVKELELPVVYETAETRG